MFSIRRMLAVTKKEFQELIRNWLTFLLCIIAPVILYFLFAYGMPLDVKNIPIAILDEDKTAESRRLIDTFKCNNIFNIKKYLSNFNEIEKIIRTGNIRACVVIPPKFSKNIHRGRPQNIQAIVDATYSNRASIIGGYIDSALAAFNEEVLNNFFTKKFGASNNSGPPISLYVSPWFNPTLRSEDFIVPGVIAIILIFLPPIITAIAISKEKETGSIINMFCSQVTGVEYLLGKVIPYIVITYFNFILFVVFTITIFNVPLRGNFLLLLITSFFYVITVMGTGLLIAVLVRTQIAAILIVAVATMLPSFMYSGFMLPVICMEKNAQSVAYMLAPTYYISFLRKLMIKGVGINYLFIDIIAIIIIGLIFYVLSIALFKKKLG